MKFVLKFLFLVLIATRADAELILRFQAHITPDARHLSDLLLISPRNTKLSHISLDSQPEAGEKITKDKIINWLNNKTASFHYKWRGKKTAVIQQKIQSSGADLIKTAQVALRNQLNRHHYSQIELIATTTPKNSEFPLTRFTVELPESYPACKRICVRLKHGQRSIPVWFTVKAYKKVLVAHHKLKRRTQVHGYDFILEERDIAGLKNKPCTRLPQTLWLKKSINTKQILIQSDVTALPEVQQGQTVQITVLSHGISINTEALAQGDGYIGQNIRMKNPKTNKYFIAMISAQNQAEILS